MDANTTGESNTAIGGGALNHVTDGDYNVAVGADALAWWDSSYNIAIGSYALSRSFPAPIGDHNIAVGTYAGSNLYWGSYNIYIGAGSEEEEIESNTIRIGNDTDHDTTHIAAIYGTTSSGGIAVYVNSDGQLGTTTSSARFKTGIADLGSRSDILYDLRPVTFEYRPEIDPLGIPQYGLIAEEVAEVAPDLVIYDDAGDPYTVRYEQLVPLLLNELQVKDTEIDAQQVQIDELLARLGALEQEVESLK